MTVSTKLLQAGQYSLNAIELIQPSGYALDIREQVEQLTIYEDMFAPFMSGNVVMLDTFDLPSILMNAGTDLLRISIHTPSIPHQHYIERYFHIYKMSDRTKISDRSQTYILHFISTESLADSSSNLSKTFRGTGSSNIGAILKDPIGSSIPFNASGSSNDVIYTSNFWSPTKNINYNCEHSVADDGGPMVFFEARSGFQFKSLTGIGTKAVSASFQTDNLVRNKVRNLELDYASILDLTMPITYDYMKDKSDGLMSSRMFTFDFTTKKLYDKTFNSNTDKRARMNPNVFYTPTVIDQSYRSDRSSILLHGQRHFGLYTGVSDASDAQFKQKRIAAFRQYQQHRIEITVFGRSDYTAGMTVDIEAARLRQLVQDTSKDQILDPMISGKYIASAVCHRFTRDGIHECTMELIRDSIGKSV